MDDRVSKTDEEWRRELTPEQYRVLRQKGTERAFTGALWDDHEAGRFLCAGCGTELFRAEDKFDSGTGWPSFTRPAEGRAVANERDSSHGMERVEVHCRRCGGHLGHVFQDGPAPTGERYCINSASLKKSR
ncbi:MAG TPA: peptide-methionine (R)-S-oxide reductase MsrB [Myxococcales bacterium]|nr:peptide-methionine (R)-S-oxide reductase MsrB [Myxococcales bacterium]